MKGLNILIIGAGIAGLTLQRLLGHEHNTLLIEKAAGLGTSGTGIMLGINGIEILERMGLKDELVEQARLLSAFRISTHDDQTISQFTPGKTSIAKGLQTYAIHRSSLHEILAANQQDKIQFDTVVDSFEQNHHGVDVQFSHGGKSRFDLVIAADGIYSNTRQQLFPDLSLRYSGYTCWRCILPGDDQNDSAVEMWGKGLRLGIVPLAHRQSYVFLVMNAKAGNEKLSGFSATRMRHLYADFGGDAVSVLSRLDEASTVVHNDLFDLPSPCFGSKRIILIGDAAHAATPNLGQGAGMAIEDAWRLAEIIGNSDELDNVLQQFTTSRHRRVKKIVDMSYSLGRIAQWESSIATAVRNSIMRMIPDSINNQQMEKLLLSY